MKTFFAYCGGILVTPFTAVLLLACKFSPRFERWFFKDIEEEQYL